MTTHTRTNRSTHHAPRVARTACIIGAVATIAAAASAAPHQPPRPTLAAVLPTPVDATTFGAPLTQGQGGRHLAIDWAAPAGTPCASPARGVVVRISTPPRDHGYAGTIARGVLSIRDTAGRLWVLRNVTARTHIGAPVEAGQKVCAVNAALPYPHVHLELYRAGSRDNEYRARMAMNPYAVLRSAGAV